MKQIDLGNETEREIAKFFNENKYWSFIIPKSFAGQPFDIIARRENFTWFIDAKHLESSKISFPFDRIEPNQITSMNYAYHIANIKERIGLVIWWERDYSSHFYLSWDKYLKMIEKGLKSARIEELERLEEILPNEYNN